MTVIGGILLTALVTIIITFTSGPALLAVVVVAGIGIGTVWINSDSFVSVLVHQRHLGVGIGVAQSFKEFGDMVGPVLVGALTQAFGVRAAFVSCGIVALMLLVVLLKSRTLGADVTPSV